MGPIVKPKEYVQAGDTFLIKFDCVYCDHECFTGWENPHCEECHGNYDRSPVIEPPNRQSVRLLAGTRRKRGSIGKRRILALLDSQDRECAYCYQALEEYHVEHIIPLSFGGSNNAANIVLSCPKCNLTAGSLVFPNFSVKQKYIVDKRKLFS